MNSIWEYTSTYSGRGKLHTDLQVPAVVIGGGLSGILIAWELKSRGISSVVLESSTLGSGQSGHTTAKITAQHGLIYHTLIQKMGEVKARQYADANFSAIKHYETLIESQKINCDFERLPAYLYSTSDEKELILESGAAKQLHIPSEYVTCTKLPFEIAGALCFPDQAQFHPLKFLYALAEELTVYEHTQATSVKNHTVYTDGGTITAQHIIFACHYPFINTPGYYFMRMHQERSYVLALSQAQTVDGMYLSVDPDGLSLRNYDGLLLLGGGQHRTGENPYGMSYEFLRKHAARYWSDSLETAHWSAQDCMTLDAVPYIGSFSSSAPDWYVATGFNKWGMTHAMTASHIIADAITGKENPYSEVFSPSRFGFSGLGKSLVEEGLHAAKGLSRELFLPPKELVAELPCGHGGIVEFGSHKAGVYKDENGRIYVVSSRCSHLGCQLSWNPDEKTWDCPCHGSRFDYTGACIDNPALSNIRL